MDQRTVEKYTQELQEQAKELIAQRDAAQADGQPVEQYTSKLREVAEEMARCHGCREEFDGGSGDE